MSNKTEKLSRQVPVSMPEEAYELLWKTAKESQQSISKVIRDAIVYYYSGPVRDLDPVTNSVRYVERREVHPIVEILDEYESQVYMARSLAGSKGGKKKPAAPLSVVKDKILKLLKENTDEPMTMSEIAKIIEVNRKRTKEALELHENKLWVIFKPKQKGQSWKIALKSGEDEKLYKAEREVLKLKRPKKKRRPRKRKTKGGNKK